MTKVRRHHSWTVKAVILCETQFLISATLTESAAKFIWSTLFGAVAPGTGAGGAAVAAKVVGPLLPSCAAKKPTWMLSGAMPLTSGVSKSSMTGNVAASAGGDAQRCSNKLHQESGEQD